jgi:hypothetical protein
MSLNECCERGKRRSARARRRRRTGGMLSSHGGPARGGEVSGGSNWAVWRSGVEVQKQAHGKLRVDWGPKS